MYIPKNKITSNLYTNGGEFQNVITGKEYIGFYYKTYDGKIFSGKNPDDLSTQPLKVLKQNIKPNSNFVTINNDDEMVEVYNKLSNTDPDIVKQIPQLFHPTPNENDYNVGQLTRYFTVKSNIDIFIEVNKETYEYLYNSDDGWLWSLYVPFSFVWTIKGEKEQVYNINKNITLLQEAKIKRKGLQKYLKEDYLKFWKS